MNDSAKPVVNQEYVVEQFDDEMLLYSKTATRAVYLNETAHAVWLLCGAGLSVGQIIEHLEQIYPEQKDQISDDVHTTLEMFAVNHVIELIDGK
ncbi:MAG: PqqD family protein [Thermodesulfobacteriota bacterium]